MYVDAHVEALVSTWYINLRAVVGLERNVVVNYRHGIAVAESDCACPDVGNVADRPDSVTVLLWTGYRTLEAQCVECGCPVRRIGS